MSENQIVELLKWFCELFFKSPNIQYKRQLAKFNHPMSLSAKADRLLLDCDARVCDIEKGIDSETVQTIYDAAVGNLDVATREIYGKYGADITQMVAYQIELPTVVTRERYSQIKEFWNALQKNIAGNAISVYSEDRTPAAFILTEMQRKAPGLYWYATKGEVKLDVTNVILYSTGWTLITRSNLTELNADVVEPPK